MSSAYYASAASGFYEVREIKPHVFVWIPEDILDQEGDPEYRRAGTAGFIITRDAVVVVDTTNSPMHARDLLYEIRKRTDLPVKYVINTDPHGDHILGNEVFEDQQATIISTAPALAEITRYRRDISRRLEDDWRLQTRMRGIHVTLPTQTFEGEMALQVGGWEIRLLNSMSGVQTADTPVYLPGAKVLYLGDLFENDYFPRIGSRDVRRWIETLRLLENWDIEIYVPGHGAPGGKKQLAEFRGFLEWLLGVVEHRIRQGKSLDQVKREVRLSEAFHWHAPELADPVVESAYHQLADKQSSASNPKPRAPGNQLP